MNIWQSYKPRTWLFRALLPSFSSVLAKSTSEILTLVIMFFKIFFPILRTELREMPVSRAISLGLLLVPGLSSWLQILLSTISMFAVERAVRGRPAATARQPCSTSSLINFSHQVIQYRLFYCLFEKSSIILSTFQRFSTRKAKINVLSSAVRWCMFI